ncbi:hypothetical protein EO98_16705 [Methanosarcina sp. 2.H.T.1A.6]|uniref:DUF3344 domain-containing protein n=1 Tax=unclassified Methanosarcina TaxID=2644672 RepID=UPI0006218D6F|nr:MULTISPECIES: DUF3344 domain-containing protein [unclassified Methanosarcina]KKG15006.1 hypothetical protein EO94_03760 [Methanosarcina sp. 2.H.T.1A.3]KKG16934.1 hypothetical protein EO97_19610 [Methanosarcina sp. 2.H.T.1A.15]KKG20705.1 hypothetical protein EO96_17750 [Methanosarcina sp. 2.H.T.1A.8]KKG22022.1 hypothetical protein EO98_16705 [Methanosarcina sp. 2.H.T.1A.6]
MLTLILSSGICLALLTGTVAADDWVGGLPLTTVQTGTVTGDLYISGNPPSSSFVTTVDRTFTLPEAAVAESGRVKWARLYVSSYCGHMQDAKYITYTTKADWNNDGTWDNTWTETDEGQPFIYLQGGDYGDGGNDNSEFAGHSTGEPYLMLNDHTNRVTSDYLSWYDVTNLIQEGEDTIKVKVDATGSYDGRIKIVELVVAYDDDSSTTQTTYWVNEGHDACSYYTEDNLDEVATGTTTFDTTGLSDITSATLIADYMASNNGYYGFPTAENDFVASEKTGSFTNIGLNRDNPEAQGDYSGIDSWDVTSSVSSSSDVTFAYARYLPATGLGQFYKIPLAFLVVKKPLQSTPAPTAEFTANPTIGETPLNVSFTDLSTGAPTSWTWNFGDGSTSNEQNPIYAYSAAGTYDVNLTVSNAGGSDSEVKTNYITATVAPTNDLTISGLVNTVPASAVFAREANTVKVMNVKNTGTATLTNISLSVYASDVSSGTVPVNTTTIASLVGGKTTTVTLIDPTIRNLEGGTVTYTAVVDPDNLISETDETNNKKISAAKVLRYNGYKGKGIYWEGGSNITTKHTYDLQGNLLYSTQPDSAYKAVGWTDRTETWTAEDLPIPIDSTIEQAFLYFAYNWDQTPGGYPWLNLNFNGNTIDNGNLSTGSGTLYRDWSNFGGYADYEYGLCVYDVTDKFSSAGNSLVTTSVGSNVNALYPSTLVVIYRNPNETRKQIFINEECDELGLSASSYGTTLEEATAYSPFTGMSIDVNQVTNAMLYSFAGSAGPDEGNLLFNGNTVATQAWQGSSRSGSPLVFNATNYISETGNEAGIQGTTSGGMDALQQILVVEYPEAAPVADFSANVTNGDAPLEVKFTDASTGTIASYSWDFNNDGSIDSYEQNPSHTYASAGTYTVNLTVTGPGGSDSEVKTGYITVSEPLPEAPVAAFTATPTSGDAPLTVNFTDQSTGIVSSYAWDFDNDGTLDSYEQSPSHTYETAGTYNVNFTVAGPGGSDSEVKEGYILVSEPLPAAPVANFTANVTSGNAPLDVQFTDASNGIVSSYAWDFDNDGNVDSTEQNPSFTYTTAGTYSVNLTVTNAGGSDFEVKDGYIIVSEPFPVPPVAAFTATPTSGNAPLTVNFTDQSTESPTSWAWDFDNDGSVDSTEQNPSYIYETVGTYSVNLTVANAGGSDSEVKTDYIVVTGGSISLPWHDSCDSVEGWTLTNCGLISTTVYEGEHSIGCTPASKAASAERTIHIPAGAKTLRFNAAAVTNSYAYNEWVKVYIDGAEQCSIPITTGGAADWNRYAIDLSGIAPGEHTFKVLAYWNTAGWDNIGFYIDNIWIIADEEVLSVINVTPSEAELSVGENTTFSADAYTQYCEHLTDTTFTWSSSNETVGTINSVTGIFSALSGGITDVKATAEGVSGSAQVTVNSSSSGGDKTPVANFTADVTSGNAPLTVKFTDNSTNSPTSWAWDFENDGTVDSMEPNPSYTYSSAGTYTVNLTVTGPEGSDSEVKDGYIVVSEPLPAAPVAGFTATPTSGDAPLTVNFTDQSTGTPTEWFWDFGDGTSANEQDASHTYTSAGTYTVNLTVTNAGGSNSIQLVDWITVTESPTPAEQPDVIVSAITLNANEVFANEANNISAKVENRGTGSAESFTVMFTVNGIDTNVTVDGLEAGANATFTITDPTIRAFGDSVTITVSADPGNEIAESSETNNQMNITKTVVYNGYKGKRYTDGNDLNTQAAFEGKYELVYSAGNTEYAAANWAAKTYAWSSTDLPIPAGATVESARLYQSYTWNKMANDPAFTMSFNNNIITPIATYKDRKGYGTFDYPCGLYVYNVTSLFDPAGNSITVTPETGNNYGIYGAYLVVVYNDPNATEKKIWINDEFDLLTSKNSYAVNNEEATAYATFSDINTEGISKATSIATLSSGSDDGKSKFFFNDNEFTGFWMDYQPTPQIGFSSYNVTEAIQNGTDTARIQSYDTGTGGDVMSAMNAILVVEYVGTQNETEIPVAAFNATPTSGDSPLIVNFTDQSTGTPTSWAWDFENDGTIDSTEQNHTHIYQTTGTYTVNLTVANEAGSNSTVKTDYIIVSESSTPIQQEPVAAFTADVTGGTAPLMVNFTDQSTNSPTSWLWDFGDGTTSNDQTVSHTYTSAGTYTVNLTVANSVGSDSEARTDYIVVSTQEIPDTTKPVIESVVMFPANTTAGSTINFSVNATDDVEVTEVTAGEIQLTKTEGIWQGSITAPSSLGDYSLQITAKDAAGNIAETSVPYRVVQLSGGANIAVSPRASSVAAGNTVSLSIKVKNTQNIDDTFKVRISVSELPAFYQADLSWFNWTEKVVSLKAGEEIRVPVEVTVPGETAAGRKLFRANVKSETSEISGFDTGYLVIS